MAHRARTIGLFILAALFLAGCQVSEYSTAKHLAPVPGSLKRKMASLNMEERAPILIRIFKQEDALEVWKKTRTGDFALLDTYEICAWSGDIGPKLKEGDRQAPEGFYMIHPHQMNPNSAYHLAFNLGFPNNYDQSHGRTGSFLMVHGDCSSRGCYAMEDDQIEIIYALARDSFLGGQRAFQVQAFPFRMTPENMAKYHDHKWADFWKMLKEGYDHFEVTRRAPKVDVCGRRYVFNAEPRDGGDFSPYGACPLYDVPQDIWVQVASKQQEDEARMLQILAARERRDQREEEWDARRAMVASFFGNDGGRADQEQADSIAAAVRSSAPALDRRTAPAARRTAPAATRVASTAPSGRPGDLVRPGATEQRSQRSEARRAPRPAADEQSATTTNARTGPVPIPRAAPRRAVRTAVAPSATTSATASTAAATATAATATGTGVAAATAAPAPAAQNRGFGIRLPNPFGRRDAPAAAPAAVAPAPPQSVANAPATEPAASAPRVAATPAPAAQAAAPAPAQPAPTAVEPAQQDGGVISGVANGTRNAVGAAASGVGSLWNGATGLFRR